MVRAYPSTLSGLTEVCTMVWANGDPPVGDHGVSSAQANMKEPFGKILTGDPLAARASAASDWRSAFRPRACAWRESRRDADEPDSGAGTSHDRRSRPGARFPRGVAREPRRPHAP